MQIRYTLLYNEKHTLYYSMIQIDNKYVNDIKLNGNSINRIYLDGEVYWGNIVPAPSPVPSQYVVVEYIRSQGTSNTNWAYINTGLYATANMKIEYSMRLPSNRSTIYGLWGWWQLWGAYVKKPSNSAWDYNGGLTQAGSASDSVSNPDDGSFTVKNGFLPQTSVPCSDNYWFKLSNYQYNDSKDHYIEGVQEPTSVSFTHTVDGVSETRSHSGMNPAAGITSSYPDGTSTTSLPFYIFGCPLLPNSSQTPRGFTNLDIFYFKIYDGTTLLRDYVPVYDTDTQKYGLYDKVTQSFYGSVNTNNFTGPAIS